MYKVIGVFLYYKNYNTIPSPITQFYGMGSIENI